MKKVKNFAMAALVTVIGAGWASAQGISTSETEANRSKADGIQVIKGIDARYKLIYPIKKTEHVRIEIYDKKSQLLFSERVENRDGFMKSYDFSNLPDGTYKIKISSRSNLVTKNIYHRYPQHDIDFYVEKNPEEKSFRLVVKGVKKNPVYVDFLNTDYSTLFEDIVEVGKSFSRVYKFEEELPGNLMIRVSTGEKSVIKAVK
jgi:hypothetical protein